MATKLNSTAALKLTGSKAASSGPLLSPIKSGTVNTAPTSVAKVSTSSPTSTAIKTGSNAASAITPDTSSSNTTNPVNAVSGNPTTGTGSNSAVAINNPAPSSNSRSLLDSPSSLDLSSAYDTGRSTTDNITRSGNVLVSGRAQAGTTITLYDTDGKTVLGKTTVNSSGNWSILTNQISEGIHDFYAKANRGNLVSPYSTKLSVTVDRTLTSSDFDMDDTTDTGTSSSDELTRNGLPVLTFKGEAGLEISLTGPGDVPLTQDTHYTVSYNAGTGVYTVTLKDAKSGGTAQDPFGTYTSSGELTENPSGATDGIYTISATDIAGNTGTVGTFEIDTTAPAAPTLFDMVDAFDTGSSASDEYTSNGLPQLTFRGSPGLGVHLYGADGTTLLSEGTHYTVAYNPLTYIYTVTLLDAQGGEGGPFGTYDAEGTLTGNSAATSDGVYTIKVADTAGNETTAGTFTIDTTAPAAPTLFDMVDAFDTGSSASDEYTSSGLPQLTFAGSPGLAVNLYGADGTTLLSEGSHYTVAYDALNEVYTVTLLDAQGGEGGPFGTYGPSGTLTGNPTATSDGVYTIKVADTAGNETTAGTFTIDTTAPVAPTVDLQTTDDVTPVITGTATLAAGETLTVSVRGETYTVTPVDGIWTLDLGTATSHSGNTPVLDLGTTYSVTASVTDAAGNVKTDSTTGELQLSSTPVGPISATYYNDYNYFVTSSPINNPAIEVLFSGTVNYGASAIDETQISWDFDGGDAAAGIRAAAGNELTGQSSGVISQLLFVVNSGQSYQTDIERDPSFAGLSGDTFDFGKGLSTYGGSNTPTTVANDIVVQYRWKITEFTLDSNYKGSMLQDFTGGMLADEIIGSANNNIIIGGGGADKLDGLGGIDTISYADLTDSGTADWHGSYSHGLISLSGMAINLSGSSISAATIASAMGGAVVLGGGNAVAGADLAAGSAGYLVTDASLSTTDMVRDQLANFENIIGSNLADYIVGSSGDNVITGGKGVDVLTGGAGADIFNLTASSAATWSVSGASGSRTIDLIGGFRVGDVFTYDNFNPIPDYWGSYEVQPGDTLADIAQGIAAAIDAGPATARAEGTSIITNHLSGTFNRFMSITAYEPDRILDFTSGTDKLQLSANEINLLLSTITNDGADSFWSLVTTPSTYQSGDNGARVAFLNSSSDFAAGGVGALIYNASTGILSLDQNGNTSASGGTLANAADDVAIVNLGAGTTLTAADITFII